MKCLLCFSRLSGGSGDNEKKVFKCDKCKVVLISSPDGSEVSWGRYEKTF